MRPGAGASAGKAVGCSEGGGSPGAVSVVVPCLNEEERIGALLEAIRLQDAPVAEVVVVDTGSTDGTQEAVGRYQRRHEDIRVRQLSVPGAGISEALNRGVEAAAGDVVIRLDGHCRPAKGYVRRALEALRETGAAIVGGVWDIAPGRSTLTAHAIARAVAHPIGAGDAAYRTTRPDAGRAAVDTVPFGCFRKATWEALGGFDEALLTNEDYEFNYRVRLSGSTVALDPSVRCTYFARATLAELATQYFRYGWWKAQMLRLHPRSLRWRQALPALLVPLLVMLGGASPIWSPVRLLLGVMVVTYLTILTIAAAHIASREQRWTLVGPIVVAFGVVHLSWSTGFASNTVSFGHWPFRSTPRRRVVKHGQSGFSGARLLLALTGIMVLAVIAPPGLATLVNQSRIERAQVEAHRLANVLKDLERESDPLGGQGITREALSEPEWVPVASFLDELSRSSSSDPWGGRYLVNVGTRRAVVDGEPSSPAPRWVLSGGPNGVSDTPAGSVALVGDDIGARIE